MTVDAMHCTQVVEGMERLLKELVALISVGNAWIN